MAGELVLISGISGFLGFRVLVTALEHGYRVRGAVRKEAQIADIKAVPLLKPYLDKLEIVVVPDILADGAFDAAAKDVDYILHIASPLTERATDDYYTSLIEPAVQGTLGMLRSAAKSPAVKRVVITSSMAILKMFPEDKHAVKPTEIPAAPDPHTKFANPFIAYGAAKSNAYAATQDFMKTQSPRFDLISILPAVILGPSPLITTPKGYHTGTNRYIMNLLTGAKVEQPNLGATVHVDDCALIHVKALDPKVEGNQDFNAVTKEHVVYNDAIGIAKKAFPEAFEKGKLRDDGDLPQRWLSFDTEKTESVLGVKWRGFEDQVKGIVGHYLELLG